MAAETTPEKKLKMSGEVNESERERERERKRERERERERERKRGERVSECVSEREGEKDRKTHKLRDLFCLTGLRDWRDTSRWIDNIERNTSFFYYINPFPGN